MLLTKSRIPLLLFGGIIILMVLAFTFVGKASAHDSTNPFARKTIGELLVDLNSRGCNIWKNRLHSFIIISMKMSIPLCK